MSKPTTLVIPVAAGKTTLLRQALLRVRRYAPELQPLLIGDPAQIYMLAKDFDAFLGPFLQQSSKDPIGNTDRMMQAALDDEWVTDPFLWSADDIFWMAPTTMEQIEHESNTARVPLPDRHVRSLHGRAAWNSYQALKNLHRPTWDYERHTPLLVDKKLMREAIDLTMRVKGQKRSIYLNMLNDEPADVVPDVKVFLKGQMAYRPPGPFMSTGTNIKDEDVVAFLAENP